MPTYRHNYRNEVITLRALLKVAIRALRVNQCIMPRELIIWARAQGEVKPDKHPPALLTPDMVEQELRRRTHDN